MSAKIDAPRSASWAGRRVTVVADFDSFLRAASVLARHLEGLGATIRYRLVFARAGQVSRAQLASIGLTPDQVQILPMDRLVTRAVLGEEDVVVLGLNGMRSRRFFVRLHHAFEGAPRRPIVTSLYPGLVFRFHLEGMTSRMAADLLLLNSPADLRLYEGALREMGLANRNAICAGLAFLPPALPPRTDTREGAVLFVAQPTVPVSREERRYVVVRLLELARRYPETRWLLKPRHRRDETTLHRDDHHYEDLLDELARDEPVPPNFAVVHDPLAELFQRTRLALTFSSTAALESLRLGVPTRILTDVGIHENIGNHFFLGSGLCCSLDEVRPDLGWREPAAEWWDDNVVSAADRIQATLARLEELVAERAAHPASLPPPYRRLLGGTPALERYLAEREGWAELGERGVAAGRLRKVLRRLARTGRRLVRAGMERAAAGK